ncbi:MAG: hypothetical protein QW238_05740 [Candidatus Bathyarchaeia archaeon]
MMSRDLHLHFTEPSTTGCFHIWGILSNMLGLGLYVYGVGKL